MSFPIAFRRTLANRLFALIAAAFPAAIAACSSSPADPPGGCPSQTYTETGCFPWPESDGGTGGGGSTGGGDIGGGGGAGGSVMCPSQADAAKHLLAQPDQVVSAGAFQYGVCCYTVARTDHCDRTGRPFVVNDTALSASPRRGDAAGWLARGAPAPRVDDLSCEERARLAAEWTRDGLFEHASIASFGRFALELMAVGAPADLVEAAHCAALDELRHAQLCLGIAAAYAGESMSPGPFPFDGRVEVTADLARIAARTVREGCIGETIAAATLAEQLAGATDPAVRAVLQLIAEDEARHAELAWRAVVWAIRNGGAPIRDAVREAFAELGDTNTREERAMDGDAHLAAHGRLGDAELGAAAARAIDEVARPAARLLLAASLELDA